jgi:ribose transport system permease protein
VLSIVQPRFLRTENILNVLTQMFPISVAAIGMTFVIIAAGIDLSVGGMLALTGCLSAGLVIYQGLHPVLGLFAAVLIGALLGLANGALVVGLALPPFIATLGMMGISRGLAFVYTNGQTIFPLPEAYRFIGIGRIGGIPFPIFIMFALYAVGHLLLSRTRVGRVCYAIGGNRTAAVLSGIHVGRFNLLFYVLSGSLSALSGTMLISRNNAATADLAEGFELDVIAAVVIGGTSLMGGEGHVIGTFLGALIMAVVRNGLNLLLVSSNWQRVVIGLIILIAVTLDVLRKHGWPWRRRLE